MGLEFTSAPLVYIDMKIFRIAILAVVILLCSSTLIQKYPKIVMGDGYIQIDKVVETKTYLEVTVYNASTEYVRGIVTIMKATNLSDNQEVIKIGPGKTESVIFPKKDRNCIVTWSDIKIHDFSIIR